MNRIARKWFLGTIVLLVFVSGCLVYHHYEIGSRELLEWNNDAWAWW